MTDGLGVALIAGLTEGLALGDGEGVSVGSGVGVGVAEGDGELASPKTSVFEGKKIDFRNNPAPNSITKRTTNKMKVGFEGLLIAIK